jgi:hypothetical protein
MAAGLILNQQARDGTYCKLLIFMGFASNLPGAGT